MSTLPALLRAARVGLDMSLKELAEEAGVHTNTINRIERGRPVIFDLMMACQTAMERRGLEFIALGGRYGLILPANDWTTAVRYRVARAGLDLTRNALAAMANLSARTLKNLEDGAASSATTLSALDMVLAELDVEIFQTEHGWVVMLPPREPSQ